ncbi:hypothetical protein Q5752_000388 [Cryptotrichosporon argae]
MSVPLPSPSPISPPKVRRPAPIATAASPLVIAGASGSGHGLAIGADANGSGNGNGNGHENGDGHGARSPESALAPASSSFRRPRASGLGSSPAGGDDNWRAREPASAGKAPERTVGGFEKNGNGAQRETVKSPVSAGASVATAAAAASKEGKAPALSHVPCRFFKASACTAGAACPFSHDVGGKKEICQWFLKGDCKFGHKCALAHVRPGEPMSMDRKNKKDAQRGARERAGAGVDGRPADIILNGSGSFNNGGFAGGSYADDASIVSPSAAPIGITNPVPIRSAGGFAGSLGPSSLSRAASSPLREPYGPPAQGASPSAPGFNRPAGAGPASFAASPSRPSPLSASFGRAGSVPGPLHRGGAATATAAAHSPLRPPPTAGVYPNSFSHAPSHLGAGARDAPLSASLADTGARRSIWAHSATPAEPLSASAASASASASARPIGAHRRVDNVFDDDDHGEDLLPSSLSDLLTPTERARRMSRRDSNDSYGRSPSRPAFQPWLAGATGERLAQSAGAALPPGSGFLSGLWNDDGRDARQDGDGAAAGAGAGGTGEAGANADLTFAPVAPQPRRQSLLTQRAPSSPFVPIREHAHLSPSAVRRGAPLSPGHAHAHAHTASQNLVDAPYRHRALDPSSPNARALQEHAPGQSLPGGLAAALSRMHMQPHPQAPKSTPATAQQAQTQAQPQRSAAPPRIDEQVAAVDAQRDGASPPSADRRKDEHEDEGLFEMDG